MNNNFPIIASSQKGNVLIFKHHFDRDDENNLKDTLERLLAGFQEWSARNTHPEYIVNGNPYVVPITDTKAIGEIREVFSGAKYLFNKYHEKETASMVGGYIDFLTEQKELDTISTIKNLQMLLDLLAEKLGINHGFKDRTDNDKLWEETLARRLEFPPMTARDLAYRKTLKWEWDQLAFDMTYYCVKCKGDAHILLSGPNLSGKSNTSIPFLIRCNHHFRVFWDVEKFNEFYVNGNPGENMPPHPEAAGVKLGKFSIRRDVYVTPESEELRTRFKESQYQAINVNEGMEAATNIQSQKSEAVQLGIKRFTTRSFHNIVIWEYQVADRPTGMMLEGMNFWFQKMKKRHFVLSAASTLIRKKDPYLMKEMNKCRSDKEFGDWMENKNGSGNPNYIHTFKSPKMSARIEKAFQMWYWESKERQAAIDKVKNSIGRDYTAMIDEIWQKVNVNHTLAFIEIGDELSKAGFNERDKASFMRDYGRYNRNKLWTNRTGEMMKNG